MNPDMAWNLRWRDGVCSIGNTIVGTISLAVDQWHAFGCLEEWEDVPLHGYFKTEQQAKKAVKAWVIENIRGMNPERGER